MRAFLNLLRLDLMLIHRNKVVAISVAVTVIYTLLFRALSGVEQLEKFLVLIMMNDPALLGVLFVGVMVLFEKDERTLQALSVTPIRWSHYLWSKTLALTVIGLLCCYVMVLAGYGWDFHWGHFTAATVLTTVIFSLIGFIVVAGEARFNTYMMKAVVVIVLLTLPFLGYFEIVPNIWFVTLPTYYALLLYNLAFGVAQDWSTFIVGYVGCLIWTVFLYGWALKRFVNNNKNG